MPHGRGGGFVPDGDGCILTPTAAEGTLELRGAVRPDAVSSVSAGADLGVIAGPVWIQCRRRPELDVPAFVTPEYSAGWLDQVSDPAVLLGLAPPSDRWTTTFRCASVGPARSPWFRSTTTTIRPASSEGWREHLIATDGRVYLDMVNNVAAIGHGHLVLADAVARQWRRLNTNSRFNYAAVVALSERLAATLPDPLDTVFLVNSGPKPTTWPCAWRWPPPAVTTSSPSPRPTTVGPMPPTRSPPRSPITRMP